MPSTTARSFFSVALGLSLAVFVACAGPTKTFHKSMVLGGKKVSARALTNGSQQYEIYCSACHGVNGDGKGPASIGLRPPPRDFRLGKFKFAAVSSGQLPHDEDLFRIVKSGLHGTAMLPWSDVPDQDIFDIIQYIKTLAPRWAEDSPGEAIVPGADPWGDARKAEAVSRGLKVYHGFAQCLLCHPAYADEAAVNAASQELSHREAKLRPDAFHSQLKESDYGVKLMPPDFTRDPVRSGETLPDLYRTIASGIGGTAMPAWKGALPEEDIWAM
ncbi:MAG TPA: c-type cytochrome, partial [Thermoanaerobaculia bacterium]|nr:c-type cytochrome [Thermoanaerobaculia bacterium]